MIFERLETRLCLAGVLDSAEAVDESSLVAFPGAAGFGAYSQGGRGGDVYHVTNLDDDGFGSLRYGIESTTGPRTIVFDLSGNIELASRLKVSKPYLTIAGQTAPGDGITISHHVFEIEYTHDIIIRYLRFRAGDQDIANSHPTIHDSFAIRWSENVIADHISTSWGIDETVSTVQSDNVTIQWSIVSEGLADPFHPSGELAFGSLSYGAGSLSLHHNLYAHHDYRMPSLHSGIRADVVNNVFYDWAYAPSAVGRYGSTELELNDVNFENNTYVVGPSLASTKPTDGLTVFWSRDASRVWASGNVVDITINGALDFVAADFSRSPSSQAVLVDSRFDFPVVPTEDPLVAYQSILDSVGASLSRDAVDSRVIQDVISQTGGIIASQTEVGGLPNLANAPTRNDSDQDGMPDYWENRQNLDSQDAEDRNLDNDGNGYTELEEYLHYLASERVIDRAIAEITDSGSIVGGDYTQTHHSDDYYEAIQERSFAGGKQDRLSNIWEFNVTGGDEVTLFFEGYHDSVTEDFLLEYSTDQVHWSELITVTENADDGTVQSASLPDDLAGTVYVRAVDTSNHDDHAATLYVDNMYIESQVERQITNDTGVHAIGENTKYGSVTGGLEKARASDDLYEELTEAQYAGGGRSRLEHTWEFELDAGNHVFTVEAHLNDNAVDTFVFEYLLDGANWIQMSTSEVTNTGTDLTYTFDLHDFAGGTILVRVVDSNRLKNEPTQDTIYVDEISFVKP